MEFEFGFIIILFETLYGTNTLRNGGGQRDDTQYENIQINRFRSLLENIYMLLKFEYNIYNHDLSVNDNKDLMDLFNLFYNILLGNKKLDVMKITPISHVFKEAIKTDKYHLLGYTYQFQRAYAQINYKPNPCFFFVKNLSNNELQLILILKSDIEIRDMYEIQYPESIKKIAKYLDEKHTV